jgi:hypothetical protein
MSDLSSFPSDSPTRSSAWLRAPAALAVAAVLFGCSGSEPGSSGSEGSGGGGAGSACPLVDEKKIFMSWGGSKPSRDLLASDATHVYWVEDDTEVQYRYPLYRAKWGSNQAELVTDTDILWAIDEGYVYSSDVGRVQRTPVTGGDAETVFEDQDAGLGEIALHADRLYWLDNAEEFGGYRLLSMPKEGGPVQLVAEDTAPVYARIWAMFVDASGVYVTIEQGSTPRTRFLRFPLAGGAPEELYAFDSDPSDPIWLVTGTKIVGTAEHVYVVGNVVVRYTKADGSLTGLGDHGAWDIALASDAAYWIRGESSLDERGTPPVTVESADHAGDKVTEVLRESSPAWSLLVDDCNLYWATTDGLRARRR